MDAVESMKSAFCMRSGYEVRTTYLGNCELLFSRPKNSRRSTIDEQLEQQTNGQFSNVQSADRCQKVRSLNRIINKD